MRKDHIPTVKHVNRPGFNPQKLINQLSSTAETFGDDEDYPHINHPQGTRPVVGREYLDPLLRSSLKLHYESISGVRFRPYTPAIMYASEQVMRETFGETGFVERTCSSLEYMVGADHNKLVSPSNRVLVAVEGLKLNFMSYGRVKLSLELQRDDTFTELNDERRRIRRSFDPNTPDEALRKRLFVNLGALQLSGDFASSAKAADLTPDIDFPRRGHLMPVDVVML